jgi:radical SAM protein with 4Fe4S-binding SPASM domain
VNGLPIFLRPISPYGFASATGLDRRYHEEDWLEFYRRGLDHLIRLNRDGTFIREEYTSIILRKILSPFPGTYVDLQSPAGIGVACLVFNYDGGVYASDEARMLAEMGDQRFRLGTVQDSYEGVMHSDALLGPLIDSMSESTPMCSDCGFQPYCGSDPVFHYAVQGDPVGFKPSSRFCRRNMGIMRELIRRLEDDEESARVFRRWVR